MIGSGERSTLRVMTYNIKSLKLDQDAAVQVVRASAPDVLGLQEPPRWVGAPHRLRRFAARAGLRVAVGGHGARTTALLVAPGVAVTDARAYRLPWRGRTLRGFAVARVDGTLIVVLHLALEAAERLEHLDRVLDILEAEAGPRVVVGDLNELPGGATWQRLITGGLSDAADPPLPTFTAARPRRRLDAVLVSSDVRVDGVNVPDDPATRRASDHLPIVVDLSFLRVPPPEPSRRADMP
ncbi:MAG: endonuclease/exonuclease/phosphatase family protein [Cellulomonas sp.]